MSVPEEELCDDEQQWRKSAFATSASMNIEIANLNTKIDISAIESNSYLAVEIDFFHVSPRNTWHYDWQGL